MKQCLTAPLKNAKMKPAAEAFLEEVAIILTPETIAEELAAAKGQEDYFTNGEHNFTIFKPLVKAKFNNFMKQQIDVQVSKLVTKTRVEVMTEIFAPAVNTM